MSDILAWPAIPLAELEREKVSFVFVGIKFRSVDVLLYLDEVGATESGPYRRPLCLYRPRCRKPLTLEKRG
jgi:hypothetical protein